MSGLGRTAGDPARSGHAAVERWLRESQARLDPEPLFRRRLRSDVMNTWVATREGIGQPPRRRWLTNRMGALGRACLYASVALCASGAGVMAASQQALPGEALYVVKLRIEELRVEVLPSEFQDELAINSLAERVEEMRRLTAAGSPADAAALVPAVERQYAEVEDLIHTGATDRSAVALRLGVVAHLVDALPANLAARLAAVMPRLTTAAPPRVEPTGPSDSTAGEGEAAPAEPAPAVAPPAAPDAEPNGEPVAPTSGGTDAGRLDDEGGEGAAEGDESDEDDDPQDADSEQDGD